MGKRSLNCGKCGSLKIILKSGATRCVPCHRRHGREYYQRSVYRRDRTRRCYLLRRYGLALEELERLLRKQDGCVRFVESIGVTASGQKTHGTRGCFCTTYASTTIMLADRYAACFAMRAIPRSGYSKRTRSASETLSPIFGPTRGRHHNLRFGLLPNHYIEGDFALRLGCRDAR